MIRFTSYTSSQGTNAKLHRISASGLKKTLEKIAKKYFDNEAIIETSKKFPACEKIV